jgi:addiction module HigA family antidote
MKKLNNIHPGEILENEFLQPLKISQNQVARNIGVSPRRINEIVHRKRSITADTSIRLAKYFSLSDGFFLGLQKDYDLE